MEAVNIDYILYVPVLEGHWKQCELWDGTYLLSDLFDIHEAMLVSSVNKQIMMDHEKRKIDSEMGKTGKR